MLSDYLRNKYQNGDEKPVEIGRECIIPASSSVLLDLYVLPDDSNLLIEGFAIYGLASSGLTYSHLKYGNNQIYPPLTENLENNQKGFEFILATFRPIQFIDLNLELKANGSILTLEIFNDSTSSITCYPYVKARLRYI